MGPSGTIQFTKLSLAGTVDWLDPYLTSLLAVESLSDGNMPQNTILGLEYNAISAPREILVPWVTNEISSLVCRKAAMSWSGIATAPRG
jgi:hypothetical protein